MRLPVETAIWFLSLVALVYCVWHWWGSARAMLEEGWDREAHLRWQRRMWAAVGVWQIMTAVIVTRAPDNGWQSGVALYICGSFFLVLAWEPWKRRRGHDHIT